MNFIDIRVKRIIAIVIMVIVIAMIATMTIPYLVA